MTLQEVEQYFSDVRRAQINQQFTDGQARYFAKKAGLKAVKSRWRRPSIDNYGGYQLIDMNTNAVVAGLRFDLNADDVVKFSELCAAV